MTTRSFTAVVQREGSLWSALCPEFDVSSQGNTVEEAKANLREAVELFLETASPGEVQQRLKTEIFLSPLEVTVG